MDITDNANNDYVDYMTNQPMRDGEEIRSFFDETKKKEIFNSLTAEERDQIIEADLKMEEARKIKAMCNHRHIDKNADSIIYDMNTNTCKCIICGAEFTPIDANIDLETIRSDAKKILDYLHTTKILYPDMSSDEAHRIYSVIPIIEDLDKIFDKCIQNLYKEEANGWAYSKYNMGVVDRMNCLNRIFGEEVNKDE